MSYSDRLLSSNKEDKTNEIDDPFAPTYDVYLVGWDISAKLMVIKELMSVKNMQLAEAKTLAESAPVLIASGVSKNDSSEIKLRLERAGAKVRVEFSE